MAKSFSSLTKPQQRAVKVVAVVQLGLQGWALLDLRRRDPAEIRGSKRLWRFASFLNFVGPIAYLAFGRR